MGILSQREGHARPITVSRVPVWIWSRRGGRRLWRRRPSGKGGPGRGGAGGGGASVPLFLSLSTSLSTSSALSLCTGREPRSLRHTYPPDVRRDIYDFLWGGDRGDGARWTAARVANSTDVPWITKATHAMETYRRRAERPTEHNSLSLSNVHNIDRSLWLWKRPSYLFVFFPLRFPTDKAVFPAKNKNFIFSGWFF